MTAIIRGGDYQSCAGNNVIITTVRGPNDGTSAVVTQEIANYSSTAVSGVLKFYVPLIEGLDDGRNGYGYAVFGGAVRDIARGDGNRLVVYVEAGVAPGEHRRVTVQPGESGP